MTAVVIGGFAAVLVGIRIAARGDLDVSLTSVDVMVIIFVGANLLAHAMSIDKQHSLLGEPFQWQGVTTQLAYAIGFCAGRLSLAELSSLKGFLTSASLAGLVCAGYALVQAIGMDPLWTDLPNRRVFSSFGQPNELGAFLVLSIPATFVALGRHHRFVLQFAVLLLVVAIAASGSRGALVGLIAISIAGLGLVIRASLGRKTPSSQGRSFILAAAGIAVTLMLVPVLLQTASPAGRLAETRGSFDTVQRLALLKVGWAILADHPLKGTGPDTYPLVFADYEGAMEPAMADYLSAFRPESPHNVPLAHAVGAGIPAAVAYIGAYSLAGVALWRTQARIGGEARSAAGALLVMIVAHAVTDLFMTAETAATWISWVGLGGAVSLSQGSFKPVDLISRVRPHRGRTDPTKPNGK